MIRRIAIRHFKRFRDQTFDLAESVVLAGPNNAGKSTLLQAVAAWRLGLDRWVAQREGSRAAARSGVAITRGDFTAVPLREMNLLWEDRRGTGLKGMAGERRLIEIVVEGKTGGSASRRARRPPACHPAASGVRPRPNRGPPTRRAGARGHPLRNRDRRDRADPRDGLLRRNSRDRSRRGASGLREALERVTTADSWSNRACPPPRTTGTGLIAWTPGLRTRRKPLARIRLTSGSLFYWIAYEAAYETYLKVRERRKARENLHKKLGSGPDDECSPPWLACQRETRCTCGR